MCESCHLQRKTKPVHLSKVPMTMFLCDECVAAGAVPYDILVTMVWLGHVSYKDRWAYDVALYHGQSATQFEADVANYADKMLECFEEDK